MYHSYILCKKLTIPAYVYFTVVLIINEVCFKIQKNLCKRHMIYHQQEQKGGVCTGDLCSQQVPSISSWFLSMATKCTCKFAEWNDWRMIATITIIGFVFPFSVSFTECLMSTNFGWDHLNWYLRIIFIWFLFDFFFLVISSHILIVKLLL